MKDLRQMQPESRREKLRELPIWQGFSERGRTVFLSLFLPVVLRQTGLDLYQGIKIFFKLLKNIL